MTDYFTADPHFGHANIIRHCKRPYRGVQEMDEDILRRWNARLRPGDRLYILGDFCGQRRKAAQIESYLSRINLKPGAITLILGNHDDEAQTRRVFPHVEKLYTYRRRERGRTVQRIVLCHYALLTWHGSGRGVWHLYGHSHGTLTDPHPWARRLDCGVDAHDFELLSYERVAELMAAKPAWRPIDHHVGGSP